jgi:hypothetical protein
MALSRRVHCKNKIELQPPFYLCASGETVARKFRLPC